MRAVQSTIAMVGIIAMATGLAGCRAISDNRAASPIVGAWIVKMPEAPFPLHMFIFHSDGTVQQSNPDAGDANTSDSSALGAWQPDAEGIKGKIVEITADRTTHKFASRVDISFSIKVSGDEFIGNASATFYDEKGSHLRGPVLVSLTGARVKL
jgi:hypothetical protein